MPEAEPQPPAGRARRPGWVKGRARKAWDQLAPILEQMQVLTVADANALALLCDALAEYVNAREKLRRLGSTYKSKTPTGFIRRAMPEVGIAADAWRRAHRMIEEFGLTPASRTRLETAEPGSKDDEFEEFLNGRRRSK